MYVCRQLCEYMEFYNILELWYLQNCRDLPWRHQPNPYFVWLSEIMLQQTRVQQGLTYFNKFVNSYPTIHDLANATEDEVLKNWQGLGYYTRARNLHATAKHVSIELGGVFPNNAKELKQLKGVGEYTAAAIASICFNEKIAVVDGNVYRVLSRYFGVAIPINSTEGVAYFKKLANELIVNANPSVYNQAIMEFGALMCKPQNPDCAVCPLSNSCVAFAKQQISDLPVKLKKVKVVQKYFNFIVVNYQGATYLEKRVYNGIWKNLFQFPLIETSEVGTLAMLQQHHMLKDIAANNISLFNTQIITHKLTHQHLHTQFWIVNQPIVPVKELISWDEVSDFAVPILIHDFLEVFNPN